MAAPIPKKIGKYEVIDVVGRGGMGVVYRAKDPFLDRMVAIKIMTVSFTDQPDLLQRFFREAKATANLQHPNIVTVYELGDHEGSPYLAMQYLEGASLDSMLRSGQPLSLLQKIDIIIEACHGLSYAHQKGIVHRDIKPGNIMVLKDASVKIVDFGIARIGDTNFTRTGQFMGSLNYMSLEQLNDKLQVDQRTDVYSTGVVLYQLLTGVLPFEADSTGATLMKILNENPAPFSKYLSSFPPEIETITLKALAKDRDQRYSSADELALDLTQLQDRLKHTQIETHMQQAELLLQQNNLFQANDELMAVLKLDKQHTKASGMLRTLRKQIEKEQSAERSRQLREQSEEALRREDFEPALGFIEQAIHLDPTNAELQALKAKVQAAKAEIDHLRQVMQRAENAHRAGNLDTAKQAIEEVLERRPNDTRVKSLHRMIQKELDERMRQKRLETLLETARKEMTNRRYTAAFDLLKEAEKVDPDAPTVRSLLESLATSRDQEQRRRDLEQFTRQIEQALNTDDPQAALNLLGEGLKRFPAEPALLKLKDLAESQNQTAQTKAFVRERIAAAREILNAGNATGALKVLQEALKKAPGNPHLESLVSIAQERMNQDRDDQDKSRCIQQANDALGKRSYSDAIRILEAGQVKFTASPEIDNLLRFAREQQTKDAKKQDVENSVRRAQEFLKNQEYDQAIKLLESIIKASPDEELSIVLEEARRRRDALNTQIAAAINRGSQFLNEGSPSKAVEFLQAQPTAFRRSDQFRDLVLAAVNQHTAAMSKAQEPEVVPEIESDADLEAPEPAKTMMWNTMAPPEEEIAPAPPRVPTGRVTPPKPAPPKPAPPRVPTGRVKATPAPAPPPVAPPGLLQRLTPQQKLLIGAAVGVLLFVVVLIAIWPSPKLGNLIVTSNVDGADVLVDGRSKGTVGTAHSLGIKLDEGHYQVKVQKDGYEPFSQSVDVVKGKDFPLSANLSLVREDLGSGTLSVQTNVDAVDVYIDDEAKQVTKGKQLQVKISSGDHTVRVSKDNYGQVPAQKVHVNKDELASVKFNDLTELTVHPGFLEITSTPGALVTVDNRPWGNIPQDGKARVQVEPKGSFLVEVTSKDAEPWKKTVGGVREGQTLPVTATLIRIVRPPAEIAFFQTDRESVAPGGTVRLSWKISHGASAEIDQGIGAVNPNGDSKEVVVNSTTTYKLTAKGEDGAVTTKETRVSVAAPAKAPIVTSFTASPATIKQGDSTTLTWTTSDAKSVSIEGLGANLQPSGSQPVSPAQTTRYNLSAMGDGGSSGSTTTVTVQPNIQPPTPQPPSPTNEAAAIMDAVERLKRAFATLVVDELRKEWTGMNPEQQKGFRTLFNSRDLRALTIDEDSCSAPIVSGDSATMTCTETESYTADGRRKTLVKLQVAITLRKSAGIWRVNTKLPTGK